MVRIQRTNQAHVLFLPLISTSSFPSIHNNLALPPIVPVSDLTVMPHPLVLYVRPKTQLISSLLPLFVGELLLRLVQKRRSSPPSLHSSSRSSQTTSLPQPARPRTQQEYLIRTLLTLRIPCDVVDVSLDEEGKRIWRRKGRTDGKLPGFLVDGEVSVQQLMTLRWKHCPN